MKSAGLTLFSTLQNFVSREFSNMSNVQKACDSEDGLPEFTFKVHRMNFSMYLLKLYNNTLAAISASIFICVPGLAVADPCKAMPDKGPMPAHLRSGKTFSGPVTYVGDGDSLCVATGRGPQTWVEVRIADFYAPELHAPGGRKAKAALERIAKGKRAVCTAGRRSYDRVVATCRIGGVSIGELMRRQGISEGGNGR